MQYSLRTPFNASKWEKHGRVADRKEGRGIRPFKGPVNDPVGRRGFARGTRSVLLSPTGVIATHRWKILTKKPTGGKTSEKTVKEGVRYRWSLLHTKSVRWERRVRRQA